MRGRALTIRAGLLALMALAATPAWAGPPYLTDDPEPTETGHWENYLFIESAHTAGGMDAPFPGIEVNYGAYENTQLTMSVPLNPNPGPLGMGVVWAPLGAGIKYRFIQEDEDGWRPQVAFFPSVDIPVGAANKGAPVTELFPLWAQKSFGPWQIFGGGGYTNNPGVGNRNFVNYGIALQRQVTEELALGIETFGQGKDAVDGHASAAVGAAIQYDFTKLWHVIGSINRGIENTHDADPYSFNLALKWTP